jgi:uncharacterized membrane protein YhaH (DUF805 family)
MRGRILGYDAETFKGVLSGHDGQRYDFVDSDWRGTGDPRPGTEVDFQVDNGAAKDIFPFVESVAQPGQPQQPQYVPPPQPQYAPPPPQPPYPQAVPQQPVYGQPAYGQQPYPQPGQPYAQQPGQPPYGQQPYPPQPMPGQPYAPGYAPPGYPQPPVEPHNGSFGHVLFSFHGRISRSEYWVKGVLLFGLLACIILFIALVIDAALGNISQNYPNDPNDRGPIVFFLFYAFLVLWPGLAIQVKRWHDRDKSGWFVLINLIPIVGAIWSFIELGFMRGTIGANRFGGDSVPHY